MTCQACGKEWILHIAHLIRTHHDPEGESGLVQCPNCGHVERIRKEMDALDKSGE